MIPIKAEAGTYALHRSFHVFVRSMEVDPQTENGSDPNVLAYDPASWITHYVDLRSLSTMVGQRRWQTHREALCSWAHLV